MIRDVLAACSTVAAIFAWWAVVFLLAGCAGWSAGLVNAAFVAQWDPPRRSVPRPADLPPPPVEVVDP